MNQPNPFYSPYKEYQQNYIYNLLFCDNLELFKDNKNGHWRVLLAPTPDPEQLLKIANDPGIESRQRALAFNRLHEIGWQVPAKKLLGVICEVNMPNGLDTLAVFSGRQMRYINHTGRLLFYEIGQQVVFEDKERQKMTNDIEQMVKLLSDVSQKIIDKIGPWDQPRLPPPTGKLNRLTFLASDGLYFAQGTFEAFSKDQLTNQCMLVGGVLLKLIVDGSAKYGTSKPPAAEAQT